MLELPGSAPGVAVAEAIVGEEALRVLARDADASRLAAEAMRRAHDHGSGVVARGDLSGSVVCHAEAFFESMANVPLFHDATTDKQHGLRVLWADSLRWQGFKRALELPDSPDVADPHVAGPIARRRALEGFDEARRTT